MERFPASPNLHPETAYPLTSLDPHEIAVEQDGTWWLEHDPHPEITHEKLERHAEWKARRRLVYQAIHRTSVRWSTVDRFGNCGWRVWLLRDTDDPNVVHAIRDTCHNRWCQPCARSRSYRLRASMEPLLAGRTLRLVTLTVRTQALDLKPAIMKLYASFRRLRQRSYWKEHVNGGLALCEVKWNEAAKRWHPHLHVLADGQYMPHAALSAEWLAATGDSPIVDIRLIRSKSHVLNYVTKYITKPADDGVYDDEDRLAEAIKALKSVRLIIAFGTYKDARLLASTGKFHARRLGAIECIEERAADGEALACLIMARLRPFKLGEMHYTVRLDEPVPTPDGHGPEKLATPEASIGAGP